jgi:hypothetical protein
MAASTLSTVAFIYKRKYSDRQIADLAKRDHPAFSMIRRSDGFTGEDFRYFIKYGAPQGISADFAQAQTNAACSKGHQLAAARRTKFGVITIDGEAMAACGSEGAKVELVTLESDGILSGMGDVLSFDMFRAGDGVLGRRSSASTNVITLTDAKDCFNFHIGMTVKADDTITGASMRTGSTTVASIDEDTGTVTLTSAAGITAFANNDYLFRDDGTTSTDKAVDGMQTLFPLTAPTSGDSFRGTDRSVHVRKLAGCRVDDTATAIEENIGLIATYIKQSNRRADVCFLHPTDFYTVARRRDAKVVYDGAGMKAAIGFETIVVHTAAGAVRLVSEPDCLPNRAYTGKLDTLEYKTRYPAPHVIRDDKNAVAMRSASADSVEIRARSFSNLLALEPAAWGVQST